MLKALSITNIILIEQANIEFDKNLNVLSGETGAGKSAILKALSLILGGKADAQLIRKGADKGEVEALFEIDALPHVQLLLSNAGFKHEPQEYLIIRREVSSSGKSRILINHQMAQRTFLEQLTSHLVDLVGQHAHQSLLSLNYHREVVDLFGDINPLCNMFQKTYQLLKQLQRELDELIQGESKRLREIESCERELEELEAAQLKEGEEEDLFSEYKNIINCEELAAKLDDVISSLSGEGRSLLSALYRSKITLEKLVALDPVLKPLSDALNTTYLDLEENGYGLRQYRSKLDFDSLRLQEVNSRLTIINALKRRYGATISEIEEYQKQSQDKLSSLKNADSRIEQLRQEIETAEKECCQIGKQLTEKRVESAAHLQATILEHLRPLNMQQADLCIRISEAPRSDHGEDHVEFYFAPNMGENMLSVRNCASGGELSRILLALKTTIASLQEVPTLIFDEVDANIGGETAALIGQKLKTIAESRQVLCITHLPQIAHVSHHHLHISKEEKDGRTVTTIQKLSKALRKKEIARMLGGKTFNEATADLAEKVLESSL